MLFGPPNGQAKKSMNIIFTDMENDDQIVDCKSSTFESCIHSSFKNWDIKNTVYTIF